MLRKENIDNGIDGILALDSLFEFLLSLSLYQDIVIVIKTCVMCNVCLYLYLSCELRFYSATIAISLLRKSNLLLFFTIM